jgi:periplasmic protein TonB
MKRKMKIATWYLVLCVGTALVAQEGTPESKGETTPAPATTPKIATPQHVRVSQGVTSGLLLKRVNPKYPPKARENGIQGTVVLHAVISQEGDIVDLTTISGDPLLAKSAIKAVKQWKYRPYLLQGKPVEVDTEIQVNYTLSGG